MDFVLIPFTKPYERKTLKINFSSYEVTLELNYSITIILLR